MYLKALEIQGFKSFPDKTVLNFGADITAIVGPNGSGKSNISDAILWVMGEQNSRQLRGAKMEDVIFGGTEKRNQMGFAQVTLIIDNTGHIFPRDESEVAVTRRYYRSGESEYYINRQSVRLKDVNELFMDTGMGREGYSIIGQGKIDEILSVKSGERREVFEEAAGISKFRHRKEESERKLQRTEENLVRINDKIAELELQVEPLRQQAETAKKYLVLRDELRVLEISVWLENLQALRAGALKLEADLRTAEEDRQRAQADLDAVYAAGEESLEKIRDNDVRAEALRDQVSQLDAAAQEETSAMAVLENSLSHDKQTLERLDRELADMDECMPHYYKITGGHGMGAQRIMEGEAALARGRLNDGAIALERARAAISGSGQENMALCCDFLEMRLHMAAGEAVGVDLRRRRQLLQQHNAMWLHIFDSSAAYCQAVLGRAGDIPELFREHRLDTVNFLGPCLPMMQMIENQVYLAQGAYARVIGGSEGLLALCRGMHYALVEIYVLVQTAAAYEKLGKRREAAELLRQAAALAQPDGLVTPLAENGRYLRELLPEYGTLGREAAELSRMLEQGTQQEQRPEALAPLTEREWAVAQRMARRLSNREIAGQLFLTEGTVKQYINQIYSKLHLTGDVRTKRRRLEELMGE